MANLRDQLLGIRAQHGRLTPEIVVDEARPEEHPLHARFEWNDTVAAEQWRREQASELIRSVKIRYVDSSAKTGEVRAFVAVRGESPAADYQPTEEALSDPFTAKLLLAEFEREWRAFKARYEHMAEFAEVILRDVAA